MFEITSQPIVREELVKRFLTTEIGALVTFEGLVRNKNHEKRVQSLEYEVFESLARQEGNRIIGEARERFAIHQAFGIHRQGHLQLSDLAVCILATAVHRGPAFQACEYIINQIKTRLPIWKKEYYSYGKALWVNCQDHQDDQGT